jgi:hypothetical protein
MQPSSQFQYRHGSRKGRSVCLPQEPGASRSPGHSREIFTGHFIWMTYYRSNDSIGYPFKALHEPGDKFWSTRAAPREIDDRLVAWNIFDFLRYGKLLSGAQETCEVKIGWKLHACKFNRFGLQGQCSPPVIKN